MKRIYLASPYSDPNSAKMIMRAAQAAIAAGYLMKEKGYCVFSPITHSKPIADLYALPHDFNEFWKAQDFCHIDACDELHVLRLAGWEESHGVNEEMMYAMSKGKKVLFWDWCEDVNKPLSFAGIHEVLVI